MQNRRRMTRREIWTQIGVSFAGLVMFFGLVRGWWRIYLLYRENGASTDAARNPEPQRQRRVTWPTQRGAA